MTQQSWHLTRIAVCIAAIFGGLQLAHGYTLSVTPRFSADEMMTRLGPLARFLTEKLHSPVEIVLTKSFEDYEKRLQSGEIDIAFSNPTQYSKINTHEVIAMESKEYGPRMRGIIIVRADSLIDSVYNLLGRSVAIVSWQSTGGFLSQKVFLEEQGIQPKTQIKLQEAHDNKQENVILAVYHEDVEAGFINEDSLHIIDQYVPPAQIRVLERTSWLPNWALSVRRTLPAMVKGRVSEAILSLKPEDPVLNALKLKEFVAAVDADYDIVRRALGITVPVPIPTDTVVVAQPAPQATPETPSIQPTPPVVVPVTPAKLVPQPAVNVETLPKATAVAATAATDNQAHQAEPNKPPPVTDKPTKKRKVKPPKKPKP